MKKFLFTIAITITIATSTFGQFQNINFDDTTYMQCVIINTISNPNNIWQVGQPQKTVFTNAYSIPNAIVTDTINSYPINDTSSFIITHAIQYPGPPNSANIITGRYYVNSDTINDYGTIEYSLNNGSWINLDNFPVFWGYPNDLPILTGNSNGWKTFGVSFHTDSYTGDTLRFRFMFFSDSLQTNKDGLMFDNIMIDDMSEGIKELGYNLISSKAFPNPAVDNLIIEFENDNNCIYKPTILDNTGKIIKTLPDVKSSTLNINIHELSSGIYYYKLTNTIDRKYATGRFIKQ